jgi:hypothetical protein
MFTQHGSPYEFVPLEYFHTTAAETVFGSQLDSFGYPEIPTIYGPVAMLVFGAAALLAPANMWVLKLFLVLAELLALVGLRRVLPERGWALCALCPLLIFEVWANLHIDAVALACMVGALACRWPNAQSALGQVGSAQSVRAGILAGLALSCRLHAFPLVFLWVWWYRDWRLAVTALGTSLCCYTPFFWMGSAAGLDVSQSFLAYWWYNAFVLQAAGWLTAPFVSMEQLRWLMLTAAVLVLVWWASRGPLRPPWQFTTGLVTSEENAVNGNQLTVQSDQQWRSAVSMPPADWLYGLLLLAGPVLNPWYALWVVPWACHRREGWTLALVGAASLGYVNYGNLGWYTGEEPGVTPFNHPVWVPALQWGILLLGILVSWRQARKISPSLRGIN